MSIFHVLSRGMMIADIIALIGSLDVVLGEIDR
jgi:NADH:ubiquinone oxidoreductase subunit D